MLWGGPIDRGVPTNPMTLDHNLPEAVSHAWLRGLYQTSHPHPSILRILAKRPVEDHQKAKQAAEDGHRSDSRAQQPRNHMKIPYRPCSIRLRPCARLVGP